MWHWIEDPKSPFEFRSPPFMQMNDMLGYFQHSLPIAYLSGDNTPAEFISVNRAPELKLFYMAFYWKRALANALGVTVADGNGGYNAAGLATIDRVQFLRNIGNNFGITGMKQVENLMINVILGRQQACENTDFHTIATRVMTGNHFVFNVHFDPVGSWNLRFRLPDNSLNTNMLQGDWKPMSGGQASDVASTSWGANRPSDVFVKFLGCAIPVDNCKEFNYDLSVSGKGEKSGKIEVVTAPQCISSMIMSRILNELMKEESANKYLVRTYATILNNGKCGATNASQNMGKDGQTGLFLIQDLIPETVMFREAFRCRVLSVDDFYKFMFQLTWILIFLQEQIQFVHNDLWGANVLLEHYGDEKEVALDLYGTTFRFSSFFGIRLIDVDNAAFNFNATRRLLSRDGWDAGKCRLFRNYYDLAYILGDMLDIIDTRDWRDQQNAMCAKFNGTIPQPNLNTEVKQCVENLFRGEDVKNVYSRTLAGARVPKTNLKEVDLKFFSDFLHYKMQHFLS